MHVQLHASFFFPRVLSTEVMVCTAKPSIDNMSAIQPGLLQLLYYVQEGGPHIANSRGNMCLGPSSKTNLPVFPYLFVLVATD